MTVLKRWALLVLLFCRCRLIRKALLRQPPRLHCLLPRNSTATQGEPSLVLGAAAAALLIAGANHAPIVRWCGAAQPLSNIRKKRTHRLSPQVRLRPRCSLRAPAMRVWCGTTAFQHQKEKNAPVVAPGAAAAALLVAGAHHALVRLVLQPLDALPLVLDAPQLRPHLALLRAVPAAKWKGSDFGTLLARGQTHHVRADRSGPSFRQLPVGVILSFLLEPVNARQLAVRLPADKLIALRTCLSRI